MIVVVVVLEVVVVVTEESTVGLVRSLPTIMHRIHNMLHRVSVLHATMYRRNTRCLPNQAQCLRLSANIDV